jgi:imidazolonepropionase-like amidohydrolase
LNAQHLIYEAQRAAHYGLDEAIAFAAVTSVPAERLGVGYRLGQVKVGYDADLVIWDRLGIILPIHTSFAGN